MFEQKNRATSSLLNIVTAIERDVSCPASELAFAQLKLLVASRMKPQAEAIRLISSMPLEQKVVAKAARAAVEQSRIYATTTQEVVIHIQKACGVLRDVDVSGWRSPPSRTANDPVADEADALTLDLMSSLVRDLMKV